MKLQGKNETIINKVEFDYARILISLNFASFSACKIIDNVIKIERISKFMFN